MAKFLAAACGLVVLYAAVTIGEGFVRARTVVRRQVASTPLVLRPESLTHEQTRILLRVEDPTFFSHHGVDLHTPGAGMTTLTQGLVKFLYFQSFRPGVAKVRQSLLAIGFDARIEKQMQLALFLNASYLGTHQGRVIRGFEDGARTFFGRPFAELTRDQYLALVAMCVAPDALNVVTHPARNAARVDGIERLLANQCSPSGWLDVYYEACEVAH